MEAPSTPERVVVLLGAGASRDADLPLTSELAAEVIARANAEPNQHRGDWRRALNFVYGAMLGHQSEDGSNPLRAVNIEKLISALRLLQERETHEVAPFVASWKTGADGVGSRDLDTLDGGDVARAIGKLLKDGEFFASSDLATSIGRLARSAINGGSGLSFREAERHVLEYLSAILGDIPSVAYLDPLIEAATSQPGGLDVITLNYDMTVETAAKNAGGVVVDRGIERWKPGVRLAFHPADRRLNLMKLHGSLDWQLEETSSGSIIDPPTIRLTDGVPADHPWIVVGDREKLSKDGPILALMRCAEEALTRATHLIVIGYSFADQHVNALIRDWLLGDDARTIAVVDPTLTPDWRADNNRFRAALVGRYAMWGGSQGGVRRRDEPQDGTPRLLCVPTSASEALPTLLDRRPASYPEAFATLAVERRGQQAIVAMTLLGADLAAGYFTFVDAVTTSPLQGFVPGSQWSDKPALYVHTGVWLKGETLTAHILIPDECSEVQITFRGETFGYEFTRIVRVEVSAGTSGAAT